MEILELKSIIIKAKSKVDTVSNSMKGSVKRVRELKYKTIGIIQYKSKEANRFFLKRENKTNMHESILI